MAKSKGFLKKLFIYIFFLACVFGAFAQTKNELEREKKKVQQEINQLKKELKVIKTKKNLSQKEVNRIKSAIYKKEKAIGKVNRHLRFIELQIKEKNDDITELGKQELDINRAYEQALTSLYLLNADNLELLRKFNGYAHDEVTLLKEWMKYYNKYKGEEVLYIFEKKHDTDSLREMLIREKEIMSKNLKAEKDERRLLYNERNQKNRNIKKMRAEESAKQKRLKKRIERQKKLNVLIAKIIAEELERKKNRDVETTANRVLSKNFFENKGRLPLPIKDGKVVRTFGNYYYNKILMENNGIDIETDRQNSVTAVFNGKVTFLAKLEGELAVIVKHGDYFSVYSNLQSVFVKNGDDLNIGQKIGLPNPSSNGKFVFHFEIWKNRTPVNPLAWVIR